MLLNKSIFSLSPPLFSLLSHEKNPKNTCSSQEPGWPRLAGSFGSHTGAAVKEIALRCCSPAGICSWSPREGPEAAGIPSCGACVVTPPRGTGLWVPPGRARPATRTVTLERARPDIPTQLVFCIASHMADTINTGSNCSSQPAKVQNRGSNGGRSWGRGGGKK